MKGNDLWMYESGAVSYKETAPDSFVQRRHKLYSANWVNFRNSQWNDIAMTRNDLGMNESDVVSFEETAPDSFTPTSFGPFSSNWCHSKAKLCVIVEWGLNDRERPLNVRIGCCLFLRDSTRFVHSYLILSIHQSFSKLGVIPKQNCVQSLLNEA